MYIAKLRGSTANALSIVFKDLAKIFPTAYHADKVYCLLESSQVRFYKMSGDSAAFFEFAIEKSAFDTYKGMILTGSDQKFLVSLSDLAKVFSIKADLLTLTYAGEFSTFTKRLIVKMSYNDIPMTKEYRIPIGDAKEDSSSVFLCKVHEIPLEASCKLEDLSTYAFKRGGPVYKKIPGNLTNAGKFFKDAFTEKKKREHMHTRLETRGSQLLLESFYTDNSIAVPENKLVLDLEESNENIFATYSADLAELFAFVSSPAKLKNVDSLQVEFSLDRPIRLSYSFLDSKFVLTLLHAPYEKDEKDED